MAKHFYFKFLPEAEALMPGISDRHVKGKMHAWRKGLTKDQIHQLLDFYKDWYGQ